MKGHSFTGTERPSDSSLKQLCDLRHLPFSLLSSPPPCLNPGPHSPCNAAKEPGTSNPSSTMSKESQGEAEAVPRTPRPPPPPPCPRSWARVGEGGALQPRAQALPPPLPLCALSSLHPVQVAGGWGHGSGPHSTGQTHLSQHRRSSLAGMGLTVCCVPQVPPTLAPGSAHMGRYSLGLRGGSHQRG